MFKDPVDADVKRKEITWIAIVCLFVLAVWQMLASFLGDVADFSPRSYEEKVLFGGMGAILLCSVLYIAIREREQRLLNQRLLASLRDAISRLNDRLHQLRSICFTSAEFAGNLNAYHVCQLTVDTIAAQLKGSKCVLTLTDTQPDTKEFTAQCPDFASNQEPAQGEAPSQTSPVPEIHTELQINEAVIGTLNAIRAPGAADFSPEEMSILVTMANMTARALESARLHEELKENYLTTLRTLMGMLGARDNYTTAHAMRVSSLALRFGEYIGLSEKQLQLLEEFAPLHDIGKISIPDTILLKVGQLSPLEREACEEHPAVGEQILRPLRLDPEALQMIRNHHERWDGGGYPDKLTGEQIPLLARLLHIVDAYDAILSERPYAHKSAPQQALAEMQNSSGTQFDPNLTKTFVKMLAEEGINVEEQLTHVMGRE